MVELVDVTPPYTVAGIIAARALGEAMVVATGAELERALEAGTPTIIVDSLTALARVANRTRSEAEPEHVIATGIDVRRLRGLKSLLARAHASPARVIALVLVDTGSRMNDVIRDELRNHLG